ncbi:Aspartic peptidase domain containing protein [Parasponia andersonii]|uniref:Aspartic peptidase domain containing protein n=1 Tax=Parasponia andersonii TaxID=3476 RepID=A0A2P5BQ12_PARAD|nr:Aspartic peptidase domain containing protein [Parasponia andersonii]
MEDRDFSKLRVKCFLCDGPHWPRECPKKKALNALIASELSQEGGGREDGGARVSSLQLLNALQSTLKSQAKGLLFVDTTINGKATKALVDTRASHNFISIEEVRWLGLLVSN